MRHVVRVPIAKSFGERVRGLIGKNKAALFFPYCRSIHTFWMKKPVDLVWVGKDFLVLHIEKKISPRKIKYHQEAFGVFEFLGVHSKLIGQLKVGDRLKLGEVKTLDDAFENNNSGQALVELALILPILMLLLFGFIELARTVTEKQKLTHVTNYAVQVGSLSNNDLKITGAVEEFYEANTVEIEILSFSGEDSSEIDSSQRKYSDLLTVKARYPLQLNIPFLEEVSSLDLTAQASARVLCLSDDGSFQCE